MFRYPAPAWSNHTHGVGELPSWSDIIVKLGRWRCRSAISGITGKAFDVRDGREIIIPRLDTHEVVLAELATQCSKEK